MNILEAKFIGLSDQSRMRDDYLSGNFDVAVARMGLINQILCVRKGIDPEFAAEVANHYEGPGVGNNTWTYRPEEDIIQCDGLPETHVHIVVSC